ncbi:MAG: hypothetical protein IJ752_08595 [Alphaproteobacteria bacterium]|nr:hypothetical protein [Alphaproteobacteria bacterium]
MLLKPEQDPVYGQKFGKGGITETTWYTGHAFIDLSDGKNEERWGLGPDDSVKDSLLVYVTGCPSRFHREEGSHYNEAIDYPVCKEQYMAAQQKVEEYKNHPELEYKLFARNCSTVASSILKAAQVEAPRSKLVGLTPHALTVKKRLMYARRKHELRMLSAKMAVKRLFGKQNVPVKSALLESLRKKPLPVPAELGTGMGDKGGKIEEKTVRNFIVSHRFQRA